MERMDEKRSERAHGCRAHTGEHASFSRFVLVFSDWQHLLINIQGREPSTLLGTKSVSNADRQTGHRILLRTGEGQSAFTDTEADHPTVAANICLCFFKARRL